MAIQGKEIMAQAVLMAQIAASDGRCQCKACRCLRRAGTALVDDFLAGPEQTAASPLTKALAEIPAEPEV